jgi:hypothetical protein
MLVCPPFLELPHWNAGGCGTSAISWEAACGLGSEEGGETLVPRPLVGRVVRGGWARYPD